MSLLETYQVSLIEADVEKARITLNHLTQELVDHICCEVENEMEAGRTFEEAYEKIKRQTGIEVLQKIQENTLFLIDQKYRIMKTTMKITGNISLAVLAMGTLFKIFHWPGAGPMLLFGFTLLCLVFFPAAIYINHRDNKATSQPVLNISMLVGGILLMVGILFKVLHWPFSGFLLLTGWSLIIWIFLPILLFVRIKNAETTREKTVYAVGVIALMIFELSTMFKMFHWPGASPLMIVGSLTLISVFLPMYVSLKYKDSAKATGKFIFVIIISIYAVIFTSLLSMNVSYDILAHFINGDGNSQKITNYFENKNAQTMNVLPMDSAHKKNAEEMKAIALGTKELRNLIHDIKVDLIQTVEQVDKQKAEMIIQNPMLANAKDNYAAVNIVMLGSDGSASAFKLRTAIEGLRAKMIANTTNDPILSKCIKDLLSTEVPVTAPPDYSWEEAMFRNSTLANALAKLSAMEKNAVIAQAETFQNLNK